MYTFNRRTIRRHSLFIVNELILYPIMIHVCRPSTRWVAADEFAITDCHPVSELRIFRQSMGSEIHGKSTSIQIKRSAAGLQSVSNRVQRMALLRVWPLRMAQRRLQLHLSASRLFKQWSWCSHDARWILLLHIEIRRLFRYHFLCPSQEEQPNYCTPRDPPRIASHKHLARRTLRLRRSRHILRIHQQSGPCSHVFLLLHGSVGAAISKISLVEKISHHFTDSPVCRCVPPLFPNDFYQLWFSHSFLLVDWSARTPLPYVVHQLLQKDVL